MQIELQKNVHIRYDSIKVRHKLLATYGCIVDEKVDVEAEGD